MVQFKLKLESIFYLAILGSFAGVVILVITHPSLQIQNNTPMTTTRVTQTQEQCSASHNSDSELYEKICISRDFLISESMKSTKSTPPEIQRVLNYRKLVVFVVNEMNRNRGPGTSFFRYWANPLNILELEKRSPKNSSIVRFKIIFLIEPGNSPVRANVEQDLEFLSKPFRIGIQNELRLISYKMLDPGLRNLSSSFQSDRSRSLLEALNNKTATARHEWNTTDLEHTKWPPDAPMLVTNYFTYGRKSFYLLSPRRSYHKYCNSGLKMLIMIPSAPAHFLSRTIIRETYGNKTLLKEQGVGLLFILGTVPNSWIQTIISKEFEKFDDIVQASFVDSYFNLTLKQLATLNWFCTFCKLRNPEFSNSLLPTWIFKADDDYLVNINLALGLVTRNPSAQWIGAKPNVPPFRGSNKFYAPKYLYAPNDYIPFLSGGGYMFQSKLIQQILQASLTVPLIHFEDVYVTGILASQVGIEYRIDIRYIPCPMKQMVMGGIENAEDLWKKFKTRFAVSENCTYKIEAQILDPKP